ncbi:MAG: tetratricopeptide repeat protein [Terriglobales bacterium]
MRRATELAPHVARYWLTLGNAYNVVGDSDSRRHALITAANADPSNAEINWNVAVGFLAEGEVQSSLPYFRRAFAMDRHTIGSGASLLLRASESVATVVSLLPPDAASRLNVLNTLVDQDNLPAAAAVWKELLASGYSFSARAALPYVNALIRAGDAGTALTAWEQLVAAQPELRPFQQEHNLVFNPDFEHAILNGGFDWSYQPSAGVSVDLENSETGRALRINFEGDPVADCGISQVLALQPNTTYELGAMQKSESLLGANGPRFQVRNLKTHAVLFTGKEFRGTFAWQESREVFRTGSETQLAEIRLVRSPANTRIRGTIWLDHISLRAVRGE